MDKKNLTKRLKVLLGMAKDELNTYKLADGVEIFAEEISVGKSVFDGNGNPIVDGEYELDDKRRIVVKEGVIDSILEVEEKTEETTEEKVEEKLEETAEEKPEETEEEKVEEKVEETEEEKVEEKVEEKEYATVEFVNALIERIEELEKKVEELKNEPTSAPVFVEEETTDNTGNFACMMKKIKEYKK